MIGGIEPATGGQVIVDGRDVADLDEKGRTSYRRDTLGFVFQFFNLVPSLTAIENVQLVAELTGRGDREISMATLDAVGLSDRADHFPSAGALSALAPALSASRVPPAESMRGFEPAGGRRPFAWVERVVPALRRMPAGAWLVVRGLPATGGAPSTPRSASCWR